MLVWLSIAAAGVVVFLCRNLDRRFASDRLEHFIADRRGTSRLASAAEFADGNRHLQIALAVTKSDFPPTWTTCCSELERQATPILEDRC